MANAIRKPIHQPGGVLRARTIALILSVTEPNVCPGAISGGVPLPTMDASGSPMSMERSAIASTDLRVHVTYRREVGRPGARVERAEQRVLARFRLQPGHAAPGIVQVAEDDGIGRTALLARGLDVAV